MNNWMKRYPPYEGAEPYLYFAFAEADSARVWKILRLLLARGCRVWYCYGPSGSGEELLRRQARAGGAALTVLYLSDAAQSDKDTKSNVLVNQKFDRPILCLDPDGADRRLSMGLREDIPHLPLRELKSDEDRESAILHAEGFAQNMLGEPVKIEENKLLRSLTVTLAVLSAALVLIGFLGLRYWHWFEPPAPVDEVTISDTAILAAVRQEARGGVITAELVETLDTLHLTELPESWSELSLFPALTTIELPQQLLTGEAALPEGDYTITLSGGGL